MTMRPVALLAALSFAPAALAGERAAPSAEHPAASAETAEREWSFSAMASWYVVPHDTDFLMPIVTADRRWLHLEARYNYEARNTASAWIGYNLTAGEELVLELTPMLGGVFGDTHGIAPGYKASLSWRRLVLYSEGEYLIDTDDSANSFFYTWSELTFSPVEIFRFGLVIQRTKAYQTQFEIQRGLLAGISTDRFELTTYLFNLDGDPLFVLAGAVHF